MRKLFVLLSLMLVFILSSCSKKEVIETNDSKDNIQIFMNLSSGVNVSMISRASTDFIATIPIAYKVYFVASENSDIYKKGDIVKITDITLGENKITIPDLKYNIYISNYNPSVPSTESDIKSMIENIPISSSILYLTKKDDGVVFHDTKIITETLVNNYSAVCILNNNFVTGAQFNISPTNNYETATYTLDGDWYYLYVKGTSTNSTIWLKNIPYNTGSYKLLETIEPNHIYEYTVTDDTNTKFILKTEPFSGTDKKDLIVE